MRSYRNKTIIKLLIILFFTAVLMIALSFPILGLPSLGGILFPGNGIWKIPGDKNERELLLVPSLSDEVTIIWDEWGVPHIFGSKESDVFFALGYCHAQDRLFQMDMLRRISRGRLSEILGKTALNEDKLYLTAGMEYWGNITLQKALEMEEAGEINFLPTIESYINGINYFIDTHKNSKPLEYHLLNAEPEKFDILDLMSILKFLSFYYTWQYNDLYRFIIYESLKNVNSSWFNELFPKNPFYQIPVCNNYGAFPMSSSSSNDGDSKSSNNLLKIISSFLNNIEKLKSQKYLIETQESRGSNNWVVDGVKSDTGKPILCNDQHWGWILPPYLYETHVVSTDTGLNFYGYTVPGLTWPIVGFNHYIAWGDTIFPADQMDWYYFKTIDDDHYIYNNSIKEFTKVSYEIKVKGEGVVKYDVRYTVHGPVLNDFISTNLRVGPLNDSNIILTAKWVPNQITYEWLAVYKMIHAKNISEFINATRYHDLPPVNIVFADINGNIGIQPTGKVPIRDDSRIPPGYYGNGSLPYNGSNGEGEWIGYVPFDDLPRSLNPTQHYLVSANQIAVGPKYKKYFLQNDYAEGYRARRINHLLNSSEDGTVGVDDMERFHSDINSTMAAAFIPTLIDVVENHYGINPPQEISNVITILKNWDYVMNKDLAGPTIYRKWRDFFRDYTFQDEFTTYMPNFPFRFPKWSILEHLMKTNPNSHWFDNVSTISTVEDRDYIMLKALNRTIQWLGDFYGTSDPTKWRWGDIHKIFFPSISGLSVLGLGPFDGSGEGYTLNPAGADISNGIGYSRGGAAHRLIVDFSNFSNSKSVISGGQSGLLNSKHYSDQAIQLFLNGKYHLTYSEFSLTNFPINAIESITYFKLGGS